MTDQAKFTAGAQRYLDGEPAHQLDPSEQASADRLKAALAAYTAALKVPGREVDEVVMHRLRTEAPSPGRPAWRWLLAPQVVRVRPIMLALAASVAILLWWIRTPGPGRPTAAIAVIAQETVLVRFELAAPNARYVSVAGSFNGWVAPGIPLRRSAVAGLWTVTLPLPIGEHQYLFVVDGSQWIPDPSAHAQVDDGFGRTNSVIVVGPRGVARS